MTPWLAFFRPFHLTKSALLGSGGLGIEEEEKK